MKRLMYAPTIYQWDTDRAIAPETWYYQWHRRLWAYFEGKEGLRVLWKAGRHSHCEDPVKHWRAGNIRYSTMPMARALENVDGVFVDTVSNSVIWDASRAGVPVLCCYPLDNRRVVLPVERMHIYHCPRPEQAFTYLDLFVGGKLETRLLEPCRSDWLGELMRDMG